MSEPRPALVLHLHTGGEPLVFALPPETDLAELEKKLHLRLEHGTVESVRTKEDVLVHIHFGQVAAVYLDDLTRRGGFGLGFTR